MQRSRASCSEMMCGCSAPGTGDLPRGTHKGQGVATTALLVRDIPTCSPCAPLRQGRHQIHGPTAYLHGAPILVSTLRRRIARPMWFPENWPLAADDVPAGTVGMASHFAGMGMGRLRRRVSHGASGFGCEDKSVQSRVRSLAVVVSQPRSETSGSLIQGSIWPSISPFTEQRLERIARLCC